MSRRILNVAMDEMCMSGDLNSTGGTIYPLFVSIAKTTKMSSMVVAQTGQVDEFVVSKHVTMLSQQGTYTEHVCIRHQLSQDPKNLSKVGWDGIKGLYFYAVWIRLGVPCSLNKAIHICKLYRDYCKQETNYTFSRFITVLFVLFLFVFQS
jgi:hypothetical protein